MSKKSDQPFSGKLPEFLVIYALDDKFTYLSANYKYFKIIRTVEKLGYNRLQPNELKEINVWLPTLGKRSFRDLDHLLRITDFINRAYLVELKLALKLTAQEEEELDAWLNQCDDNRQTYKKFTSMHTRLEYHLLDTKYILKEIARSPKWKKLWTKILWIIQGKTRVRLPKKISNSNMN
jgi:hypothetical protein